MQNQSPAVGRFQALLAYRARWITWSRAAVSANAARLLALTLISVSVMALVGWAADVARLVQPLRSLPPLRLPSALGLLVLGIGLLSSSFGRWRRVSLAAACGALLIGSIPIQHALGVNTLWQFLGSVRSPAGINWHNEPPAEVAVSSGVYVLLGGIGLLAILSRRRGLWSSITLAAVGGIVMLLATTVAAGQLMGFLEGVKFGPFLGSSPQSTLCAIALATHFNALAWSRQAGFSPPPAWLPLSVGAGSLITVLIVWRALLSSEESHLAEQSRVAALATRSALNRQLMVAQRSLRRMVRYSRAPDSSWSANVTQITEDVVGIQSIEWTDSAGIRLAGDTKATSMLIGQIQREITPRLAALRQPTDQAVFIPLGRDSSRSLMILPRCAAARCSDLFIAVISASDVLGAVLTDTVLGFEMAIGNRERWFRTSHAPPETSSRFMVPHPIIRNGPEWQLGIWPSERTASMTPSTLSDFVLLLGIAVSVLLAVSLRLAQSVSQSARLEERETLDRALQSTTDGLWEWDIVTGAVTRSPQLWARLGYGDGAQFGRMTDWIALVHPQDRAMVEERLSDHLNSRAEAFDARYRVKNAAGRWHDFMDRGRIVLRSPDGRPLRLLGMFADFTDRRHAEESLRQAETMSTMGRLAARIAHEINNPLAGIQSAFLLIKDSIPPTHPHIKYVGAIEREVERISQVTRQLYETYRPETEGSLNAPVQTVVGDAVAFLEQLNRNTGVSIAVELGGIAAVVRLSDSILRQCVYNLVQNAIEASPAGSTVLVSGAIENEEFVLRVRDRGPGVPIEMRERIFDPFVSTKASQLSTGGMGLGLSLVRRAVDAAGGSIAIFDAAGGGAEFVVHIPLAENPVHGVTA